MDRTKLRRWLSKTNLTFDQQRLYFAMLAHCGNEADVDFLRQQLKAPERSRSLDAVLGCYVALKGESGLKLLRTRYFRNPELPFIEKYAAVQALRFASGLPEETVPRESIVDVYRFLLNDPTIADLIIPDLTRLNDWESIDRLVELFKKPDYGWARLPIINLVRACPKASATERLRELNEIDSEAVDRAKTFFPLPGSTQRRTSLRRALGGTGSGC